MRASVVHTPARGKPGFVARVLHALVGWRLAAVALVTLLMSVGTLFSPALLDFFSPAEIAVAWLGYLSELAIVAALLLLAFTVLDEALPATLPFRLTVLCAMLLALSGLLSALLHAYYAGGFQHLPPTLRVLADSLRWGLPAVFLTLIADLHQRALRADAAARAAELSRAQIQQAESEQQLSHLQAQIEPHFLFNVLGNLRRLYRTQPQAAAEAIGDLMRYLRTALPQLRSRRTSLGEEVSLVRSYLELFQLRMGSKLSFSLEVDAELQELEFPPMLLVTLVENAIKHGLLPAGGGRLELRARRNRDLLEVTVLDDGVGFGAAASSGTGVGLINIRRQLLARYQNQARLVLQGREPRGACASVVIPLRSARGTDPMAGGAVAA